MALVQLKVLLQMRPKAFFFRYQLLTAPSCRDIPESRISLKKDQLVVSGNTTFHTGYPIWTVVGAFASMTRLL